MANELYGHGHDLNPRHGSLSSFYSSSRSLLAEPYVPPSSLVASSSTRFLSSSLIDRYFPSESNFDAVSAPSGPYSMPASIDLIGTKRPAEAFYEQSVMDNHNLTGQSEAWLSTNLLAKRPRFGITSNLPVYPQRPGEKDCTHYMFTRTCKFGDACKFDHPIWVPEGGIPDWKEVQQISSHSHSFPERPGEPDCPYFVKTSNCKFGSNCKFNHPKDRLFTSVTSENADASVLPERPSEPPCSYYVKTGKCKFGANCKFHHPKDIHISSLGRESGNGEQLDAHKTEGTIRDVNLVQPPVATPAFRYNSKGLPIRLGEVDCPFYMKTGSCKYGAACRYSHPDRNSINPAAMDLSVVGSSAINLNLGLVDPAASILRSHDPRLAQTTLGLGSIIYAQRPGAIECDHYMKTGECKFGEKCKFHHPIDRSNPNSNLNSIKLTLAGLPRREGATHCAFYMKNGTCKFGAQCRFDHPPPGEVMGMAIAQETSTLAGLVGKDKNNAETTEEAKAEATEETQP